VALLAVGLVVLAGGPVGAGDLKSWDTVIPDADKRFRILKDFNHEAVLDKETELVWERAAATDTPATWTGAQTHCYRRLVGGRMGWRLPTIEELTSLVDLSVPETAAKLPLGHPFEVGTTNYWSSTTAAHDPGAAWFVRLASGEAQTGAKDENNLRAWCVRGSRGHDAY
jgi:hypothetical protein